MISESSARSIVVQAVLNLNEELPADEQIQVNDDTELFGSNAELDSLGLVSVLVDVETLVSEQIGRQIMLTDDRAMSRDPLPFTSVRELSKYIVELAAE